MKKKKKSANQNSPICMKTTDIKLYINVDLVKSVYRYISHEKNFLDLLYLFLLENDTHRHKHDFL